MKKKLNQSERKKKDCKLRFSKQKKSIFTTIKDMVEALKQYFTFFRYKNQLEETAFKVIKSCF